MYCYFRILQKKRTFTKLKSQKIKHGWRQSIERTQDTYYENRSRFRTFLPHRDNPQGNSIIEIIHQAMGNMLRAFELEDREIDPDDPWNEFLQACAFAIRSTFHTTLQASPGQ
jgi:hypothetical protein